MYRQGIVAAARPLRAERPTLVVRTNYSQQWSGPMKKLAIALSAGALAALLSGCAYDNYAYDNGYNGYYSDRYVSGYGNRYYGSRDDRRSDRDYRFGNRRFNCRYDYDSRYC